jgi:hypothetical protein
MNDIKNECNCTNNWFSINDIKKINDNHICFCSGEKLLKCNNFKNLVNKLPLLGNLIEKQNISFIHNEILPTKINKYNNYYIMEKILLILINFCNNLDDKKQKIITSFVLFDIVIRNIDLFIEHATYNNKQQKMIKVIENTKNKLEYFIVYEPEYITYANEYNVKYFEWYEIFCNTLNKLQKL